MAKKQYRESIDNLSYATSTVPYAKAPVKEILALTANKEADYIETKNAINLTESLKKTIPYHESSKGIYDEMVSTIDKSLSAITPENYSDNTLNTKQIAIDAMNKYGGIELGKQKADYDAKAALIAASGIRPEKQAYKLAEMAKNTEPITKDEKGNFVVKPVPTPRLVPEQDIPAKLDGFLKDWKANTLYTYNANGTLDVSKELAGKLGITKTEQITEEELRSAAMSYLELDPNIQEYLDDEADFMTKGRGMSVQELYKALSPAQLETLIPGKKAKDITAEDVRLATEGNEGMLQTLGNHLLKKSIKDQYVKGYSDLYANKYSYTKDDKTFVDDVEFIEATKARYAPPKAGSDATPPPLVNAYSLTTLQEIAPTSIEELDKSIDTASNESPKLVKELKDYEALMEKNEDGKGFEYESRIAEVKKKIEDNDIRIQQAQEQKKNITNTVLEIAKTNGINIDESYNKNLVKLKEETFKGNLNVVNKSGYKVDISDYVKNGKVDKSKLPINSDVEIFDKNDVQVRNGNTPLQPSYIIKDGDTYTYYSSNKASKASSIDNNSAILKTIPASRLVLNDPTAFIRKTPTKEQYAEEVSKAYINSDYEPPTVKKSGLSFDNTNTSSDYFVDSSVTSLAKNIRKIAGEQPIKINKTFDYLAVDEKAGAKTAARQLLTLQGDLKDNVLKNAAGYKVYNKEGKLVDLPMYLKEIGIDMSEEYVDKTAFKPNILLTADREFGQQLDLSLPLTEKGREKVKDYFGDAEFFTTSKDLTLVGVNSSGKASAFNAKLSEGVRATYMESFKDLSAGGEETRKQLGLIAFNNSRYAKEFYDKNLYSLGPSDNVLYTTPDGDSIRINAMRRNPNPSKMSDNDYFITDAAESATFGTFVDNQGKVTTGLIKNTLIKDKTKGKFTRQFFASPEDIGSLLGKSMLNNNAFRTNTTTQQNAQTTSTGRSYTVAPEKVIANDYNAIVNNVIKQYGTKAKPTLIADASGNEKSYALRVPASQLSNLQTYIPDNIDGANLPYVHNSIVNKVVSLVEDYGLTVTGALRDEKKNAFTKGSAENSLHQYGFSTDHRYNDNAKKLLAFAEANPTQLASMGINNIFKHTVDGVPHLHIDYNS